VGAKTVAQSGVRPLAGNPPPTPPRALGAAAGRALPALRARLRQPTQTTHAKLDTRAVRREHGEVHAETVPGRAERVGGAREQAIRERLVAAADTGWGSGGLPRVSG